MFTFKPASKNGSNGNGQGNGHSNGNGNGNGQSSSSNGNGNGNGNGSHNGNGHSQGRSPLNAWLGLVNQPKNGNGHSNGNGNGNGHSHKIESVLGPGLHFQGTFTGAGGVRIEGTFDGSLNVKGAVVVADGAKVTANIQAASVSVAGTVQGDIVANKVEIRSTGRVFGDLVTTAFATEEGAFLRGQVRMEDDVTAPAPAQLAAPAAVEPEVVAVSEAVEQAAA